MGVVHLFGQKKADDKSSNQIDAANCNQQSAEIVQLVVNAKIAKGVPAKAIYRQMEALMVSEGVDFNCSKTQKDFKIISYLVQGIYDRQEGGKVTNRSVLGETLRFVFDSDCEVPDDTEELFGDLLGQL